MYIYSTNDFQLIQPLGKWIKSKIHTHFFQKLRKNNQNFRPQLHHRKTSKDSTIEPVI